MPYKDTWGDKAKKRSKNRSAYFLEYKKKRSKEKIKARGIVFNAVKSGKLKPRACQFFGEDCQGRTEAHHIDYKHPLYLVWLCSFHHREEHNLLNKLEFGSKKCLMCKKQIDPPKKKYCSNYCNLKHWRKKKINVL